MSFVATQDGRLFVDVRGEPTAPPVLYLHGGPGMSCYTFAAFRAAVPHGEVHEFAESAHFVQLEQADEYADLVSRVAAGRR